METNTASVTNFINPINFSESFHVGMELFKKNWRKISTAYFAFLIPIIIFLIPLIVIFILLLPAAAVGYRKADFTPLYGLISGFCGLYILLLIFLFWLQFNYQKILFNLYDGKNVEFRDMFKSPTKKLLVLFLVTIVFGILEVAGLLLFIVPGIIVALMYMFSGLLVVDQGLGFNESMNKSYALTNGRKMELFGFVVLLILITSVPMFLLNLLGSILKIPDGLISLINLPLSFTTGVIVSFAQIDVYRKLLANYDAMNAPQTPQQSVPDSNPESVIVA